MDSWEQSLFLLSEYLISKSIAIVGGGVAGITAAIRLKDLGYFPTIFEADSRVGGKVLTVKKDEHLFEMGAAVFCEHFHEIRDLASRVNHSIETNTSLEKPEFFFEDGQRFHGLTLPQKISYVLEFYLFLINLWFKKNVLHQSDIASFYGLKKFPTLYNLIGSIWTGMGYGYLDEVSAKYFPYFFQISKAYLSPFSKQLASKSSWGMSSLWEQLAKELNVRLNVEVTEISLLKDGKIQVNGDSVQFDALIFACPPYQAKKIISNYLVDYQFLNQFKYIDYHSFLIKSASFPVQFGYFPSWIEGPFKRSSSPVCWYQPYKDDSHILIYSISDQGAQIEEIEECIKTALAKVDVSIDSFEERKSWKYFPHFSPEDIDSGIFNEIESLQGKNNIYWAGEYLSFATLEHSARNASQLVKRYF